MFQFLPFALKFLYNTLNIMVSPIIRKNKKIVSVLKNVNPNPGDRYVLVRRGLRIPQVIKTFMQTLTPQEENIRRESKTDVVSHYNVKFNKRTLKIEDSSRVISDFEKFAIEYAVKTNLRNMDASRRSFVTRHWNGYIYMSIKKLLKPGYAIPWHRDSHYIQEQGVRYKGFCVGAVYVNIPVEMMKGGDVSFARNGMRFKTSLSSGTSVTFFDDEIFHKVEKIEAPQGLEYLPRSAFFFTYGADINRGIFKAGISEHYIPGRNFKKFYRTGISNNVKRAIEIGNMSALNVYAKQLFGRNNVSGKNLQNLYKNLKMTFSPKIQKQKTNKFVAIVEPVRKVKRKTPKSKLVKIARLVLPQRMNIN